MLLSWIKKEISLLSVKKDASTCDNACLYFKDILHIILLCVCVCVFPESSLDLRTNTNRKFLGFPKVDFLLLGVMFLLRFLTQALPAWCLIMDLILAA